MTGRTPLVLAGSLVFAGGCLGARREGDSAPLALAVQEGTPQADQLWQVAEQVLREHRFRLDRVDRAAGVITTFPVGSQHWFEFWRHDVATRKDFAEATLNPIRRWVEVTVSPADAAEWERLAVIVHKQRLSAPDRQFTNSAAAYQFFSDTLPTTAGEAKPGVSEVWLDLGRDPAMEERLLGRIATRAGLGDVPATPADNAASTASDEPVDAR